MEGIADSVMERVAITRIWAVAVRAGREEMEGEDGAGIEIADRDQTQEKAISLAGRTHSGTAGGTGKDGATQREHPVSRYQCCVNDTHAHVGQRRRDRVGMWATELDTQR